MLKEAVISALQARFGDVVSINAESREFAVFAARHPDVGDVVIDDDGEELIVSVGTITHGHFGSYEDGLSEAAHHSVIVEDLIGFLDDLFADRVLLFAAAWGGGWSLIEDVDEKKLHSPRRRWFKWSGPMAFKGELN